MGDLAVLDPEPGSPPAVIAGDAVDPHPHQLGDIEPAFDVAHELGRAGAPRLDPDVCRGRRGRRGRAARGVPRRLHAELAGRAQIQEPGRQHTLIDKSPPLVGDALGVERLRAMAALAVRVFGDRDRFRENPLVQLVTQKARAAGDRGSRNRPQEMRDEAARDTRIEHDRAAAGRHLAGAEPPDRALAGAAADLRRIAQIGAVDAVGEIVVALHGVARPADDRRADRVVRAAIAAGEPVGGGNRDARPAPARFGAFGIGDALDRERGFFRGARPLDQLFGAGLHRIHHVEARPAASDFGRIGQAAERVFRHGARHRDGALDELRKHFRRAVAR